MNAENWKRAQELFDELIDLAPEDRTLRVAAEPAGVRELLDGMLANDPGPEEAVSDSPTRIGAYEVVRSIERGGMGEVLLAKRADGEFDKAVAIKLLLPGLHGKELLERFSRERQVLATLDHPHIARLLDSGTVPGERPYFVMEYVDGARIDEYCDARELPLRARIELLIQVADAVEHAHANGVVHRDLKPSNILVRSDGEPRLLDFGIARVEDTAERGDLTGTGRRLFTPDYASPEQVRGERATRATDVHALGVVLFELLTGRRPHGDIDSLHELEQRLASEEPPPAASSVARDDSGAAKKRALLRGGLSPAALARGLRGDLDTILGKALEPEPARRYSTAADFADDLRRHLDGKTIVAVPPTFLDRASRAVRRHPWRAAAGAAATVATLALGLALAAETDAASTREELTQAVHAGLDSARALRDSGRIPEARQAIEGALDSLDDLPGDEERDRLEVTGLDQLGLVQLHEGEYEGAIETFTRALERLEAAGLESENRQLHTHLLVNRAYSEAQAGYAERADRSAEEALAYAREYLPVGDEALIDALLERAARHASARRFGDATALLEEATAMARSREDAVTLGQVLAELGMTHRRAGNGPGAEAALVEALGIYRGHYGDRHPGSMQLMSTLAAAYLDMYRLDDAERWYALSAELRREVQGVHPGTALSLFGLARVAFQRGDLEASFGLHQDVLFMQEEVLDAQHPDLRSTLYMLGWIAGKLERSEEAAGYFEAFVQRDDPNRPSPRAELQTALYELGNHLAAVGRLREAEPHLEHALELEREALGGAHPVVPSEVARLLELVRKRLDPDQDQVPGGVEGGQ